MTQHSEPLQDVSHELLNVNQISTVIYVDYHYPQLEGIELNHIVLGFRKYDLDLSQFGLWRTVL